MTDRYMDEYNVRCPNCGGYEMIEAFQAAYGAVSAISHKLGGTALYHTICRNCGIVVRSYVKDPEKLLRRRDRKREL